MFGGISDPHRATHGTPGRAVADFGPSRFLRRERSRYWLQDFERVHLNTLLQSGFSCLLSSEALPASVTDEGYGAKQSSSPRKF